MIDVFKSKNLNLLREESRRETSRRVKGFVLLAVILFAAAWQTVHYQARFRIHSSAPSVLTTVSKTSEFSAAHSSDNHDECLICRLKQQISTIFVFHAPRVVFRQKAKIVRAALFLSAEFYRSTENLPTGGRAPPAPFLS
ncbi:MAG: hypothetical protein H0U87_05135 [Acidobacteria bacterium]|nr:hypothetical protein [Acidobacteriota bacterium]